MKKIIAMVLTVIMLSSTISTSIFAFATNDAKDTTVSPFVHSVTLDGDANCKNNDIKVMFEVPDGYEDILGIQLKINAPEGFTINSVTSPLITERWNLHENIANNIVFLESGDEFKTLTEIATPNDDGKYHILTLSVNADETVASGEMTVEICVVDVNVADVPYENETASSATFTYVAGHTEETVPGKAATCTEAGLTDGAKCSVCQETLIPQEEISALGHTEKTVPGKEATCTEAGLTDGVQCSVCQETITPQEEISALGHTEGEAVKENEVDSDCENPGSYDSVVYCITCKTVLSRETVPVDALGHTEEIIPGKKATCTEAGLTDGVKCSDCGEILTAQVEIPAEGHAWNTDEEYKPRHCTACSAVTVVFVDKVDNPVYEAIVASGSFISDEDLAAAEAALPTVYGYEFFRWDDNLTEEIIAETTLKATYKKIDDGSFTYNVTIDYIKEGEEPYSAQLPFDTKVIGTDLLAGHWTLNEEVFSNGTSFTAYVACDMDFVACLGEVTEPSVTIINDVAVANTNDNSYVTFAHVNTAGKKIQEIGFIYTTKTTYDIVTEYGHYEVNFTMDGITKAKREYEHGVVPGVGADFMVTYGHIQNEKETMRYARAYVIFEGDEQVYYSNNITSKIFNKNNGVGVEVDVDYTDGYVTGTTETADNNGYEY